MNARVASYMIWSSNPRGKSCIFVLCQSIGKAAVRKTYQDFGGMEKDEEEKRAAGNVGPKRCHRERHHLTIGQLSNKLFTELALPREMCFFLGTWSREVDKSSRCKFASSWEGNLSPFLTLSPNSPRTTHRQIISYKFAVSTERGNESIWKITHAASGDAHTHRYAMVISIRKYNREFRSVIYYIYFEGEKACVRVSPVIDLQCVMPTYVLLIK